MRRLFFVSMLLLSVLLMSLGGLTTAQDDGPEFIEIGSSIPLTGRYAGGGAQVERGYTMAIPSRRMRRSSCCGSPVARTTSPCPEPARCQRT
jgi:hypothetical protein